MLVSTHTGRRHLLPAAPPARATGAGVASSIAGLIVPGVIVPAATTCSAQVECAPERAYRRQHVMTSPVPAVRTWRAADRRPFLPSGESSASSPPV